MLMEPPRENPQTSHPEGRVTKWRPVVAHEVVATRHRDRRSVSSAAQRTKARVCVLRKKMRVSRWRAGSQAGRWSWGAKQALVWVLETPSRLLAEPWRPG